MSGTGPIPVAATPAMIPGMPPPPAWTLRPYQTGDEYELVELFQQVFGKTITPEYWRWKLKHRTTPVENVWVAVHGQQPVFHYAGIPVQMCLPGGQQTVMVAVDAMTDPAFRRQGLLSAGARVSHSIWQDAGIPFVLGLPNEQYGSRTAFLGWQSLFPLKWLIRPLHPERTLARRLHWAPLSQLPLLSYAWNWVWDSQMQVDKQVHIRSIRRAGQECDIVWQRCQTEATITVIRDSAWLNWRYLSAPGFDYQLLIAERDGQPLGYLVYRIQKNTLNTFGFIADLVTKRSEQSVRHALLTHALQHLRTQGVEAVATLAVPHTWLYRVFRQAGFLLSWGSFDVSLIPLQPALPLKTLHTAHNWHVSGGDFDIL